MNNEEIRKVLDDINKYLYNENKHIKAYQVGGDINVIVYKLKEEEIIATLSMPSKNFLHYLQSIERTVKYRLSANRER